MALVSISEAAKLTGKSRRTLYRHIDTGKLSLTHSGTGERVIDTSELLRVYGELSQSGTQDIGAKLRHDTGSDALLKAENERLRALLAEKDERLKDKQEHIDSLNRAMLLLEAPRKSFWGFFKKEKS